MLSKLPEPFHKSFKLVKVIVRVSKEDSSYLYFTLEACEGLCFYSTLSDSMGKGYRDIAIHLTSELYPELMKQIDYCQKSFPIEILEEGIIGDEPKLVL